MTRILEFAFVKLEAIVLLKLIVPNKMFELSLVKFEEAILLEFIDPNNKLEVAFVRLQEFVKVFDNNVFNDVPFWVKEKAEIVPFPEIVPVFIIFPEFVKVPVKF